MRLLIFNNCMFCFAIYHVLTLDVNVLLIRECVVSSFEIILKARALRLSKFARDLIYYNIVIFILSISFSLLSFNFSTIRIIQTEVIKYFAETSCTDTKLSRFTVTNP